MLSFVRSILVSPEVVICFPFRNQHIKKICRLKSTHDDYNIIKKGRDILTVRKLKEKNMLLFCVVIVLIVVVIATLGRNIYLSVTAGPYEVTSDEIAAYYENALEEIDDSIKKGVQQVMLGTVAKNHDATLEALKRVKAAGYDYIELNDFMIEKSSFIVKLLTKFGGMDIGNSGYQDWHTLIYESGLKVSSLHSNLGAIEAAPEKIAQLAKSYGTDTVVITGMYRFDYSSLEEVTSLAERLDAAGKALKEQGIRLLYHNHNCELQKVESGKTAYEFLIENTDAEYVNFELDTYWMADGGADLYAIIDKLGSRLEYWHINDRGNTASGPYMTPILKEKATELGSGNMNLEGLLAKIKETGVEAVILETHMNWIDNSPVKSIEVSSGFMNEHF